MGKRNKNVNSTAKIIDEVEVLKSDNEEIVNKSHKRKKNKNKSQDDGDKDKCKKIKIDDNQASKKTEAPEENMSDHSQESLNKAAINKTSSVNNVPTNEKPKKIKFGEDGEVEIQDGNQDTKDEKSYLNAEEREVQDEDINQFCNDIDDEDNKQYESWIASLEEQLRSNINTSSNKKKKKKKKKPNLLIVEEQNKHIE